MTMVLEARNTEALTTSLEAVVRLDEGPGHALASDHLFRRWDEELAEAAAHLLSAEAALRRLAAPSVRRTTTEDEISLCVVTDRVRGALSALDDLGQLAWSVTAPAGAAGVAATDAG